MNEKSTIVDQTCEVSFAMKKKKKKQVTKNVAYYIVSSLINNIQSVSIVVGKSRIWDKRNKISP